MLHVLVHREQYAVGPFASYEDALQAAAGLIERQGDRFSVTTTRPENGYIDYFPYIDSYPVRPIKLRDLAKASARWYVVHHRPMGPCAVGPFACYEDAHEEALLALGMDAGSYGPLPSDVSIVEAVIKDGRVGPWLVIPPRPID